MQIENIILAKLLNVNLLNPQLMAKELMDDDDDTRAIYVVKKNDILRPDTVTFFNSIGC